MRFKRLGFAIAALVSSALVLGALAPAAQAMPAQPNWANNATIYEVNLRQYTAAGTFKAFETHLPRLKKLGVKILWLMPVHPISVKNRKGTLGSYYSIADYKKVNPEFGTDADFAHLMSTAHSLGFKVVLDWVANHTGWDNPWITAHPDWYTKDSKGNITWPPGTDWTDVADLNYNNQAMRAEMIDSMKYWVTKFDVDGFRADVAGGVPTDFWNQARVALDPVKPMWMLAEDESNRALLDSAFSANYGWSFLNKMASAASSATAGQGSVAKLSIIDAIGGLEEYPKGTYAMTFITNHDENSWNATEYERFGKSVKLMSALYFTAPGMPLIYSGQEVGLNRKLAFFEKDEIKWTSSPMTAFYTSLVALKTKNSALATDATPAPVVYLPTQSLSALAYGRADGKNKVLVLLNPSNTPATASLAAGAFRGTYYDAFTGAKVLVGSTGKYALPAFGYRVLSTVK